MNSIRIIITGKVQGVFYRQSTKEKALSLNITGTVKNLPDGNVEIIATGEQKQLVELLEWCKQGPKHASVTDIKTEAIELQKFDGFTITR